MTLVAVAAIHAAAIVALINAFGVDAVVATARSVAAFAVPLPSPSPLPEPARAPEKAAPAAPRATPKPVVAPKPKVIIPRPAPAAPPAASTGTAAASGASTAGAGSGAGGSGSGAGGGGSPPFVAQPAVKIAGDIVSARDYPRDSRDARIGQSVVISLRVGTDGQVKACRVIRPSPVPEADSITCRLASERFRFRPARDQNGDPIESSYGWRQSWFTRG